LTSYGSGSTQQKVTVPAVPFLYTSCRSGPTGYMDDGVTPKIFQLLVFFSVADPGCLSRIPDPKKPIPDPGVKKAPDPRSRIRIRNTGFFDTQPQHFDNFRLAIVCIFELNFKNG
jgi:hypothetical protein